MCILGNQRYHGENHPREEGEKIQCKEVSQLRQETNANGFHKVFQIGIADISKHDTCDVRKAEVNVQAEAKPRTENLHGFRIAADRWDQF